MLTSGESCEAYKGAVREQPFENRVVRRDLSKIVWALCSGAYGYPACESCELAPTVALIFLRELAKRPTCLDLLYALSMDGCPAGVVGPASQDCDYSALLIADGYRCAGGVYQWGWRWQKKIKEANTPSQLTSLNLYLDCGPTRS